MLGVHPIPIYGVRAMHAAWGRVIVRTNSVMLPRGY